MGNVDVQCAKDSAEDSDYSSDSLSTSAAKEDNRNAVIAVTQNLEEEMSEQEAEDNEQKEKEVIPSLTAFV